MTFGFGVVGPGLPGPRRAVRSSPEGCPESRGGAPHSRSWPPRQRGPRRPGAARPAPVAAAAGQAARPAAWRGWRLGPRGPPPPGGRPPAHRAAETPALQGGHGVPRQRGTRRCPHPCRLPHPMPSPPGSPAAPGPLPCSRRSPLPTRVHVRFSDADSFILSMMFWCLLFLWLRPLFGSGCCAKVKGKVLCRLCCE